MFDLDEIQKLQDSFSKATGVASIITEPDGTPITKPSGFSFLCQDIIRKTDKGLANCMHSDAQIGSPRQNGPCVRKCLSAGLIDGGASIMVGDIHIANWMIGQVMEKGADEQELLVYADEIGVKREDFQEGLRRINKISREQFDEIAKFLFLNARILSDLAV